VPVGSIGLTGGIGSGKSTVADMLVALGARLVDTDAIARSLTVPGGAAMPALAEAFGPEVVDASGALDRARMRTLAFADRSAKQRLESILHPLIGAEAQRQAALAAGSVVVYDVPLLVESAHWRRRVDRVLVVDCPESVQVQRVVRRSGWSAEAVLAVIAQQAARPRRRAAADAVIHNDGLSLAQLTSEVAALWARWTGPSPLAQGTPRSL
jgi:dephospho-CoA kinase